MPNARVAQKVDSSESRKHKQVPRRVLAIDDNEAFLDTLATVLHALGHEVRTTSDVASTLAIAREFAPDVVLLDVYMPSPTGFSLARELRRLYPPSRMMLVMMSGLELDEQTLLGAGQAGFDHCIGKLVSPQELDQLLSTAPVGDGARPAE